MRICHERRIGEKEVYGENIFIFALQLYNNGLKQPSVEACHFNYMGPKMEP